LLRARVPPAGFIVDDLVEPELLDRLEAAAWGAWGRVKSGEVAVADNTPDAIQVSGLLAPEFGADSAPFAEHLSSAVVERYARLFCGDKLRLGFIGLWVSDGDSAYDSTWHRDTGGVLGTNHREDVDEPREFDILRASRGYAGSLLEGGGTVPSLGAPRRLPVGAAGEYLGKTFKWQMALHEDGDPCLFVCPGTHQRFRTEEERQALCFEWETDGKNGQPVKQLATEVQLKLKRGQAAVWAGSLIHRGRKPPEHPVRMSLIGNIARADLDIPPESPKEFLMVQGLRESWASLPRGHVLQGYYDNWLAVHAGAEGWPAAAGNAAPKL
jgi:hypothetical protein